MRMKGKKPSDNLCKLMGENVMGKDSGRAYSNVKKVKHLYMPKKKVTFVSTLAKSSRT